MKKFILYIITFLCLLIFVLNANIFNTGIVFASPKTTLYKEDLAQALLMKLQNTQSLNDEIELLYKHLDVLCDSNTQYFSYKIKEIENLMDKYRENIVLTARNYAQNKEYQNAVEFLESKSNLFKDKTTINSLISHYSKFFVKDGLYYYENEPNVVAVNKLIAYSNLAFKDNPNYENLDNLYLTSKEFNNLLNELYINDYILIDIYDYLDISGENVFKRDLYLPLDKKPIILLFNNINYSDNENCFIDKFIIDAKDKIATFSSKQTEKNQISYNADFIPILENFIDENKNFSFNNARGVISFDKNNNILGYNINKTNPNSASEIQTLKKIASYLKDKNYKFAYGNFVNNTNIIELEETNYIKETLFNIFSTINIYISPNKTNNINSYYKSLYDIGFRIFLDNSNKQTLIKNNFIFLSYVNFNGKFLREKNDYLGLNYEKIYDHNNRYKIFN